MMPAKRASDLAVGQQRLPRSSSTTILRGAVGRLLPYAFWMVLYVMIPGAGEFAENLMHFAAHGHAAHAVDDAEHEPQGDEHGCSGPFHVCQCHSSVSFLLVDAPAVLAVPDSKQHYWCDTVAEAAGHPKSLFRPPIA